jgi:hypothetical protein
MQQLIVPVISFAWYGGEAKVPWYCVLDLDEPLAELIMRRLHAFKELLKEDSQLLSHNYTGCTGLQCYGDSVIKAEPISVDSLQMIIDEEGVFFQFRACDSDEECVTAAIPEEVIAKVLEETDPCQMELPTS